MRTGELGFWWHSLGGPPSPREPLPGSTEADVAIVGAGFTGLWTAYYLKRADPSLRIVVLEAEIAGFGASGRNGGWVSGFFSGPPKLYERARPGGFAALQRAMFETVDEVVAAVAREGIEADLVKDGHLGLALGGAQLTHLRHAIAQAREHGLQEADLRELSTAEVRERVHVEGALGGAFSPHVARMHPAKLLGGLASVVERLGVSIHESTPVREIAPGRAVSDRGTVSARWVVRATEGYTSGLRGQRRTLVPINSSMVVTEPLSEQAWAEIGWRGAEVIGDEAHVYVYLQRTADGRIAIGGRGVPYRYGSRTDGRGDTAAATVAGLRAKLAEMFPAAAGAEIEHAWSGVLGVSPRLGHLAAGRPLHRARLGGRLCGRGRRRRQPRRQDPARSDPRSAERAHGAALGRPPGAALGARAAALVRRSRGVYSLYRHADALERRSGRASRLGSLGDSLSGRA